MPPPKPKPINPLRQNRREISAPIALNNRPTPAARPPKRACPNKQCAAPDVQDGVCHNCGWVVDESNIVAEVQFSENSSGAAVVQGSYLGADQGGVRSSGHGLRGMASEGARENTLSNGRKAIMRFAGQFGGLSDNVIQQALQIFKLAAGNNFIQGRRLDMVAAVCLYSACRKESPCTIMLIDFADQCHVNVFKLGRTFKDLHAAITLSGDGIRPILPEDLIYRFASKLEFGPLLDKVADDACRMVKRMSFDWMVMGRRPSGVCGACLILAARMNNFRRTVTEVVYIVKVTTHTIKKRLSEFKLTPSSNQTIEEFLNNEWISAKPHDPPSFYERTEEFQKNKKLRRKRTKSVAGAKEGPEGQAAGDKPRKRAKISKTKSVQKDGLEEARIDADGFVIPPRPVQQEGDSAVPIDPALTENETVPIDPQLLVAGERTPEATQDRNSRVREVDQATLENLNDLIDAFGDKQVEVGSDSDADEEEDAEDEGDDDDQTQGETTKAQDGTSQPRTVSALEPRTTPGRDSRKVHVPDDWANDESELEAEIMEIVVDPEVNRTVDEVAKNPPKTYVDKGANLPDMVDDEDQQPRRRISPLKKTNPLAELALIPNDGIGIPEVGFDPHSAEFLVRFEDASVRAEAIAEVVEQVKPQREVRMDVEIDEDEFADDPEVINCLLSFEASIAKEKLWLNENSDWLRRQQMKEYQRQMAANGPPKATRNRKKKPRIGEGASTASTPAEAAVDLMKQRSFSKKINYDALQGMFEGPSSRLGSAATSRVTSQAGSVSGSRESSLAPSETPSESVSRSSSILMPQKKEFPRPPRSRAKPKNAVPTPSPTPKPSVADASEDEEPDSDDDDYVKPGASAAGEGASPEPPAEEADWRSQFKKPKEGGEDGDGNAGEDEDEAEDYGYENGDVEDDNASVGGFSNHDFDDDDGY